MNTLQLTKYKAHYHKSWKNKLRPDMNYTIDKMKSPSKKKNIRINCVHRTQVDKPTLVAQTHEIASLIGGKLLQ